MFKKALIVLTILLFITLPPHAGLSQNSKLTELSKIYSRDKDDLLLLADDPNGTPASRGIPIQEFSREFWARDYGAVRGGVTDCTTAIQAAIDAANAAGGGKVRLDSGAYLISSTLVMKAGVTLEGDGLLSHSSVAATPSSKLTLADASNCDMIQIASGTKNATLRSLFLYGNGANQSTAGDGISQESSNVYIEGCKIQECFDAGIAWSGSYGVIRDTDCTYCYKQGLNYTGSDLTIIQSEFQDNDYGDTGTYPNVTWAGGAAIWISGKTGSDNSTNTDGMVVTGNENQFYGLNFQNNDQYALYNNGGRDNRFIGCFFLSPSIGDDAVIEAGGVRTIYDDCIFWVENTNSPLHVTSGTNAVFTNCQVVKGGSADAFELDAGTSIKWDGVQIYPNGTGDYTADFWIDTQSSTENDAARLRFILNTVGNAGTSIVSTRLASGYGDMDFIVRGSGGEVSGLYIDPEGVLKLKTAASPTTDADGELAVDLDAWASGYDALEFYNGTHSAYVVATQASDTPANGQVPTWNTGGIIDWQDPPGAGGGDSWSDAVDSDIIPGTDDTYDLGDATHEFTDGFFDGTLHADVLQLDGADANPSAAGEVVYDNTVTGLSGGALRWYDNDSVRVIVDLETDPSDDDYVVAYDADADGFYMKADAGGGAIDTTTVDAATWSDGANASNIWTFDVSGSDTAITFGDGVINVSLGTLQNGGSNVIVDTDIGSTVQTYDADLDDLADGSLTASKVAGVADADYGDIVVSSGAWGIDADIIVMADLNQDNEPSDGDILTYDSTGANFAWITQNAGTDMTADLEEETHASEHAVSGGDTVFPADPGADRYLMWDDDPGQLVWSEITGGGDLKADGTVPLTAAWDAGSYAIRAETFESDVATGTAPLTIASTTVVTNLNADLLDGESASAFQDADADLTTYAGITPSANVQTFLGYADFDAMQAGLAIDDIITLTGIAEGTANLGTFTGTTISDSTTVKNALQELETAVELAGGHAAVSLNAAVTDVLSLSTQEISAVDGTADKLVFWDDGNSKLTYTALTDYMQTVIDDADEATFKATVNLEIGTDVQAYDADLDDLADGSLTASKVAGVADADYGEIVVSSGAWTVDDGAVDGSAMATNTNTSCMEIVFDGGGSEIADATYVDVYMPFSGTITRWTALADQSGIIEVEPWRDSYANFPPTVADTIIGAGTNILISAATKNDNATMTGWTKTFSAGDIFRFYVNNCTTITQCTVAISFTKN